MEPTLRGNGEMGRTGVVGFWVSGASGLLRCFDHLKVELRTLAEPSESFSDQFRLVRAGVGLHGLTHA